MFNRFVLMSLYDMERFEIGNIVAAASFLGAISSGFSQHAKLIRQGLAAPARSPQHDRVWTLKSVERIRDFAIDHELNGLKRAACRAFDELVEPLAAPVADAAALETISRHCSMLSQMVADELAEQKFYTLGSGDARWFEDAEPFGLEVEDAFPSAAFDIEEAAKCRALGRWTASVMHLMRVMEVGLAALARHYGIDHQANWNQVLNQIEAKTREIGKRTHGEEAEQWAAEAATHLRFVKNAWRNHAMHPRSQYDPDRAKAVFENTRSFMQHLATKLIEDEL